MLVKGVLYKKLADQEVFSFGRVSMIDIGPLVQPNIEQRLTGAKLLRNAFLIGIVLFVIYRMATLDPLWWM